MGFGVNGCCCISLRTAGLLHGWIGIALLILAIGLKINHIVNYNLDDVLEFAHDSESNKIPKENHIYLGLYIIDILISGLLLAGIYKKKHYLLLPWLTLRAIGIVVAIPIGFLILLFSSEFANPQIVALVYAAVCGLFVWSWMVIYSLYEKIRQFSHKQRPIMMPYYDSEIGLHAPPPPYEPQVFEKIHLQKF